MKVLSGHRKSLILFGLQYIYRISANSFRGKYSFLKVEIQRSQYINVRKLFKGGNYSRKYGSQGKTSIQKVK
jgi:hypothetical protein